MILSFHIHVIGQFSIDLEIEGQADPISASKKYDHNLCYVVLRCGFELVSFTHIFKNKFPGTGVVI